MNPLMAVRYVKSVVLQEGLHARVKGRTRRTKGGSLDIGNFCKLSALSSQS